MNIVTRAEAKQQGLTTYYTGEPCKHNHLSLRSTSNGICTACAAVSAAQHRTKNPDKYKKYRADDYERRKPQILTQQKQYRVNNWASIYQARKDSATHKVYMQNYMQNYHKRPIPQAKMLAYTRFRQLAKSKQTPNWALNEKDQIEQLYVMARKLSESTGIKHEVDHIIPLTSDCVCGLHCLANLQILTKTENRQKWNYYKI